MAEEFQALTYIHSMLRKNAAPGLYRIQELLSRMGNPEKQLRFIHIAGTNGKGSTAAMTAAVLQQAGFKTGLFTSPFLYRFHERFQINGQCITDSDLNRVTEYVKGFVDTMAEPPTEFELVCAIAFEFFRRKCCDLVVLEVGMGGSVDATNVIPAPVVAVVTNIGLDHTEHLGSTLEAIAGAKAGIIKPGCRAVIYRNRDSVEAVFAQACQKAGVTLTKADFEHLHLCSRSLEGQVFDCGKRKGLVLPLLGDHQLHNAAVVLSVMDVLQDLGYAISEENIRAGFARVSWPGRFDIVCRKPLFIIDGGHNPQCIDALEQNIRDYLAGRELIVLTGVLADKDYVDMYAPVMPYVSRFVCITPPTPRRLEAEVLAGYLRQAGAHATACASIREGVETALALAGETGVVLSFGSLYSIGDIHNALNEIIRHSPAPTK